MLNRVLSPLAPCTPQDILARPWLYEIDPHHPLAQYMAFCVLGGGPLFENLAPGGVPFWKQANSGTAFAGSPWGTAARFTTTNQRIDFGLVSPIVTSDGAGTGDFTLACVSNPFATAGVSDQLGQRIGSGALNQARMVANADKTLLAAIGKFAFGTHATATSSAETANTAVDGNFHAWLGRRLGTAHSIWRDGIDATASSDTTVRDVTISSQNFSVGGFQNSDVNPARATIPIAVGWDYALPDVLIRAWSDDPFQMFRPRQPWTVVGVAAGGGTVIPVLMHNYRRRRAA